MNLFDLTGKNSQMLICDIGTHAIKLGEFRRRGRQVSLHVSAKVDFGSAGEKKAEWSGDETIDRVRHIVHQRGWRGRDVFCLASGTHIATHTFTMPVLSAGEMDDALRLRLQDALSFSANNALLAYRLGDSLPDNRRHVTVVAAESIFVERLTHLVDSAGLRMVGLTSTTATLPALVGHLGEEANGVAVGILHIGASTTTLAVVRDGHLLYSRDLRLGGDTLTDAFMRPIIGGDWSLTLDRTQAEALKREVGIPAEDERIELERTIEGRHLLPIIQPVLNKLLGELRQSLQHLERSDDIPEPEILFLSGGGTLRNLKSLLTSRLGMPVLHVDYGDLIGTEGDQPVPSLDLAPTVGQALTGFQPLDLLAGRFRTERILDRIKSVARMVVPAAAAMFIALFLSLAGHSDQLSEQVAAKERELAANQEQFARIDSVRRIETDQKMRTDAILTRAGRQPNYPALLKEFSHLVPDSITLTRMRIRLRDGQYVLEVDGEVHVAQGAEAEVTRFARVLESSPFLGEVHLEHYNASLTPTDPDDEAAEDRLPRFRLDGHLVY